MTKTRREFLTETSLGLVGAAVAGAQQQKPGEPPAGRVGEDQGGNRQDDQDERAGELRTARDGIGRADGGPLQVSDPGENGPEDIEADEHVSGSPEAVESHEASVCRRGS